MEEIEQEVLDLLQQVLSLQVLEACSLLKNATNKFLKQVYLAMLDRPVFLLMIILFFHRITSVLSIFS